jgi:hypothetical protein
MKNKNQNGVLEYGSDEVGKREKPMIPARNPEPFQCGMRSAECGMNGNGDLRGRGERVEFDDLRSKMSFLPKAQ